MEAVIDQLSDYELAPHRRTGGKPLPTLLHGAIQFNVGFELKVNYPNRFRIASEVLLDTQPVGSTPDLVLYPATPLDFKNDPSRRTDAPLLVVEIQSASQSTKEMVSKLDAYFQFGVTSCWIIIPDLRAVLVYSDAVNYQFFHGNERLVDNVVAIDIELTSLFA